uniref:Uncharacterized protein n=1 Tax=Rhizophora mucronata TaxID=61149 RepID=A0A2P2QW21_RHIMU
MRRGPWLLPVSLVPLLGASLYLVRGPSPSEPACFSGSHFIKTVLELEILAHDGGEEADQDRQH